MVGATRSERRVHLVERHHDHDPASQRQIDELWEAVGRQSERTDELASAFQRFKRQTSRQIAALKRAIVVLQDSGSAVAIKFSIGGDRMPGQITVDTTNETATVDFVDDKGNDADAPAGVVMSFSSDNEAVATVVADADNPLQADITPTGLGSANISATSNGSALEADGVTPIPDPEPKAVTVSAGAAAGENFVLSV